MGTEEWENGDKFTGRFKKGVKMGKGWFLWLDGSKYEGEFSFN